MLKGLFLALLGTMALLSSLDKPRIAAAGLHVPDIMGLVASGFCFGIAFVNLIKWFQTRREGGGGR
jgi:hypothetical protein